MCEDGNHQGRIADTSVTRRTMILTMTAAAAAGGVGTPAFADDPGTRPVTEKDVNIVRSGGEIRVDVDYTVPGQFPGFVYQ